MKPLIIYHGGCTDGLTAAWVALRALGDADLYPGYYGNQPPDVAGRDVYVLDFSYPLHHMERLADQALRLVVLDHHKTAREVLGNFGAGQGDVDVIFDMARSGARLAWDYFIRGQTDGVPLLVDAEKLVDYVEDRDLWRWALPDSRLVSAAIEAYPRTMEAWDRLARTPIEKLAREGEVIQRYRERCIESVVSLARLMTIGGNRVPAANSSEMRVASDSAHVLAEGYPFGATYWIRHDSIVQFSLRSREDGADVSEIAKSYGGGGHKHAAGFQVHVAELRHMLGGSEPMPGVEP